LATLPTCHPRDIEFMGRLVLIEDNKLENMRETGKLFAWCKLGEWLVWGGTPGKRNTIVGERNEGFGRG